MIPHIHKRSFGTGPRPVLAIHCSLAHSVAWRGVGAALGDLVTLHAFDLPAHGKSGDWDEQRDIHDVATDMAAQVMDEISPEPIDIIGHSFGATVALRLAIERPERVRSFVMYEPVFFAPAMADDPAFTAAYRQDIASFDAAVAANDQTGAAQAFNAAWGGDTAWQDIPQPIRDYMTARIFFVQASDASLMQDSAGLLVPGRFEGADMPALLMRGATSPWAEPMNAAIARRLPQAELISLDNVGHMGPITQPEAVSGPIREFLARA